MKLRDRCPAEFDCGQRDVHVWTCWLNVSPCALNSFEHLLSEGERKRARGFRFAEHRDRFIASHGILRILLSRYLRTDPAALEFSHSKHGKPFIAGRFLDRKLDFNLAHSENLVVLAITHRRAIGIDIERVRPVDDLSELVARFSKRERALFEDLASGKRLLAFFKLWTRKEAWLKATGEGIGRQLDQVEVSFATGIPARFLGLPPTSEISEWNLYNLTTRPGFVAALAIPNEEIVMRRYYWSGECTIQRFR